MFKVKSNVIDSLQQENGSPGRRNYKRARVRMKESRKLLEFQTKQRFQGWSLGRAQGIDEELRVRQDGLPPNNLLSAYIY